MGLHILYTLERVMKIAVLFPGQGSQYAGMGKEFFEKFKVSSDIYHMADKTLGFDLSKLMLEGPEDELKLTYNAQPALLTCSIAIWEVIKDKLNVCAFAGHSLGEYSALVAAGSMTFEDAVLAVHNRGKFMQEAVPVGVGAMAAVLGGDADKVVSLCKDISRENFIVEPANFNCDGQVVVAGNSEAVDLFVSRIRETGAKRGVKLPVSAPFHCSLMNPAQTKMAEYLSKVIISDIKVPVYNNIEGKKQNSVSQIRNALIRQVSGAVRWTDEIINMINEGIDTFVEVGAGNVLTGLVKKISKEVKAFNISTIEDMKKLGEQGV